MILLPRDYQTECVGALYNYFATQFGNPVCALPTGTGKSVVIAMFLESIYRYYPRQKVLVLTHVKELIQQNYEKLMALWPTAPAGINSAGLNRRDIHQRIIFAGIASVAKLWAEFGHVDLVIIDEAHLVSPNDETMYRSFLQGLLSINPHVKVIGFTATPWRLGHGRITEDGIFTDIAFDITGLHAFNRLIAEGYILPLIPKQTQTLLKTDGVHMRGGEFIAKELQNAVDKEEITHAAVQETIELGHDRHRWLVFAAGVDHAIHTNDILNDLGVPSVVIHSKMGDKERDKAIRDYRAGRYRAAVNNNVLTTGFDDPTIDLITMLRPTASPVLWVQMLGRGTRPFYADGFDLQCTEGRLAAIANSQKQNCLVLDFAGNTRRLGPVNDPVIPKKKGSKMGDAPVRLCDSCGTWNHASARPCIYCGTEFPVHVKLKQAASTQALIKADLPIIEIFKIDHMTFAHHTKHDRPPSIKVTYYCGYRMFNEFVCIEHAKFAGRKAREWWRGRTHLPFPGSTADALLQVEKLRTPTHLRIWVNKQYPEIMAHCFDGTAFGTEEAPETIAPPTVNTEAGWTAPSPTSVNSNWVDDDIPF